MTQDNISITIDEDDAFLAELESNRFQPPPPVVSDKQREKTEAREMKQFIMQQERESPMNCLNSKSSVTPLWQTLNML